MATTKLPAALLGSAHGAPILATRAAMIKLTPEDVILGAPEAPVTLFWYTSPTSFHCARWHNEVFPQFNELYVQTGRVRVALMEFLTAYPFVAEDCFLVCRGAGPRRYFRVLATLFARHEEFLACNHLYNHRETLWEIASAHGVSRSMFAKVLSDPMARSALRQRVYRHSSGDRVNGTPTFIIGDRFFEGRQSIEDLADAIEDAERTASVLA